MIRVWPVFFPHSENMYIVELVLHVWVVCGFLMNIWLGNWNYIHDCWANLATRQASFRSSLSDHLAQTDACAVGCWCLSMSNRCFFLKEGLGKLRSHKYSVMNSDMESEPDAVAGLFPLWTPSRRQKVWRMSLGTCLGLGSLRFLWVWMHFFLMTITPNFPNLAVQKIRYIDMFGLIARVGMTLVVDHSGRMHIQRKPTIKDVVVNKEAYCISIRVKQGLGDFCCPKALGISDGGAEPSCLFGSYM